MTERDIKNIAFDLEEKINEYKPLLDIHDIGIVVEAGDGIARASGLRKVKSQELVIFENNINGFAFNLEENQVGIIILGDHKKIFEGMHVQTTGRILSVPVGKGLIGRVVNALGQPIDGKGGITAGKFKPIERLAPSVVERKDVDRPVQTGIKSIDAMVPIGRGQRQLIIGDRQTGKTAIAIDTIINQKGKDLICIYVAIGQKKSAVARTIAELERYGAMEHTIVVLASADDPAALQYIAPYSGCAIGEEFMDNGLDALVIYDDLSKHAWSYRQISLLLNRPPGREAYPGDVFYLHARLLERAAQLSDNFIIVPESFSKNEGQLEDTVNGKVFIGPLAYSEAKEVLDQEYPIKYKLIKEKGSGGSLTALPIIETLLGDVSAYIPTNVISITDGQIYLENSLFNAGIRPAINVGISVSRVGGEAQSKAMKKVASSLRMDMASYRELAAFAQLGSDLDKLTQAQLNRGLHLQEILKQPQYEPMSLANQVVVLYAGINGYTDTIPLEKMKQWEQEFVLYMDATYSEIVNDISTNQIISDNTEEKLIEALDIFNQSW